MAKTKQFTITVDNQPGAVARIAKALGDSKVNILSLLGTAQGTAGTVQLVAEDAKKAKKALDAAHISYQETPGAARAAQQGRSTGAMPGVSREEGRQPGLHPRDGPEGREEGRRRVHRGSRRESRNGLCVKPGLYLNSRIARQI
ncbi:MAG TPA: hypothetical protein VJN89_05715 [Candidatus Acidoferrum sp.]|nr:hypothetical protein [Candidatus Acidoferrum sp.]